MFSEEMICSLNNLELEVYKYVVRNADKVCYMRIREFADAAHVSTSTILRFCKKAGCDGYAEFKIRLRQHLEQAKQQPDKDDVSDVLCAVGGLDIAAMTVTFLGCAHEGIAAAVDGYISVVAALCAVHLCPAAADYLFLSHQSYELGYARAAQALGLTPCLALDMRLGEGSGCPLLFRVLEGACGVKKNMATFSEAAIQDDYLEPIRSGDSFTVEKS